MNPNRINGLDLARFFAFAGMVIVNFKVVMVAYEQETFSLLSNLLILLEGKAAATFVVLAGIGVAISHQRSTDQRFKMSMAKRSVFLLVIGLINMTIFEADIIHYYAFYIAIGMWLIPLGKRAVLGASALIVLIFPLLFLAINYDSGWHWETMAYTGFWTPVGFVRNLFYNGWHPIFPWLAFFTFGLYLAKLDLSNSKTARKLALFGALGLATTPLLSLGVTNLVSPIVGAEFATLFGTPPVPPGPFYMLNGISAAMLVIGLCLLLPNWIYQNEIGIALRQTGQATLSLYFAHIVLGMGVLEALGLIGTTSTTTAALAAAIFIALAIFSIYLWRKSFNRGPLEGLMNRVCA